MKKLLCLVLLALLVLCAFTSCNRKDKEDEEAPTIKISKDGYWVINGEKSDYKAVGADGKDGVDGADGVTPTIEISEDGYWVINGEKTNVKANSGEAVDENPYGLQFFMQDDGTYLVSCGNARYLSDIVIPATYNGGAVVGIADSAFAYCPNLTSVIIPEGVTSIGEEAFTDCYNLTSVIIPEGVTSIGEYAFSGCYALEYNEYDNAYYLGSNTNPYLLLVCAKTQDITTFNIHEDAKFIYDGAFASCFDLTSIIIPEGVISIGQYAFNACDSLTSIVIPDSVTSIGDGAFCCCYNLTSVVICNSITSIDDFMFAYCHSLTSIVIPDSVTSIDYEAFDECINLTDIYYTGTAEEWANIDINYSNNAYLANATIHYNYVPEA